MKYNLFNRFAVLRNDNPDDSGGSGDPAMDSARENSFAAGLEAFLAEPDSTQGDPPVPVREKPAPVEFKADDADPDPVEDVEEEEDFRGIGSKADTPKDSFDEAAFDAQTAEILKSIESKGHPGDVYKSLREEVKNLKKEKSAPLDITKSPEYSAIQEELTQLRDVKAEVEGLRQRNQELLSRNDEVAVRESPEFIKNVTEPVKMIEDAVEAISNHAQIDPKVIFDIILEKDVAKQDIAIERLEDKIGRRSAGRIERFVDDWKAIEIKRKEMMDNVPKTIADSRAARERELQQEKSERLGHFKAAAKASFESYAKRIPGFVDSSGQLTDVAQTEIGKAIAIDPDTLSPDDLGYMTFAAQSLPAIRKAFVAMEKELKALRAGASSSSAPFSGTAPKPKGSSDEDDKKGLLDRMRGMEFEFRG